MPKSMNLTIETDPVGWQRPGRGKYGNRYTPDKTRNFQRMVQLAWSQRGKRKLYGPLTANIMLVFRMPKSWPKKQKERLAGKPMTSKPDVDNVAKSILDALNKLAWDDDAQVYKVFVTKVWGWEPCITVTVREDAEIFEEVRA